MYRKRTRCSKKLTAMRDAKKQLRINSDSPDYPAELPTLRRRIIIYDYDFGEVVHQFDLYKTDRIDCYRVEADNRPWKDRIGWSKVLVSLRKSFLRVGAN